MNCIILTDRLRLREFELTDSAFIVELLNSEGWLRFIGKSSVQTEEQARNYLINGPIKSYRENGYGLCMVERTEDDKPIGMCGIIKRDNLDKPDIGFAFLPEFHGKGYAFEIASATLEYAKETLNIPEIYAITVAYNEKSIKLLERIGLKFIKTIYMANDKEALLLFSSK
jgi:RimJ/RimL family protein N-acetyltransferase